MEVVGGKSVRHSVNEIVVCCLQADADQVIPVVADWGLPTKGVRLRLEVDEAERLTRRTDVWFRGTVVDLPVRVRQRLIGGRCGSSVGARSFPSGRDVWSRFLEDARTARSEAPTVVLVEMTGRDGDDSDDDAEVTDLVWDLPMRCQRAVKAFSQVVVQMTRTEDVRKLTGWGEVVVEDRQGSRRPRTRSRSRRTTAASLEHEASRVVPLWNFPYQEAIITAATQVRLCMQQSGADVEIR